MGFTSVAWGNAKHDEANVSPCQISILYLRTFVSMM
jgi:hypothetical protein